MFAEVLHTFSVIWVVAILTFAPFYFIKLAKVSVNEKCSINSLYMLFVYAITYMLSLLAGILSFWFTGDILENQKPKQPEPIVIVEHDTSQTDE